MKDTSIGYIIDNYSPYQKNSDVVAVFKIYGITYCIREVKQFEWGQPVFPEKDLEDDYTNYHVYDTLEKAEAYVNYLKRLDGSRFNI